MISQDRIANNSQEDQKKKGRRKAIYYSFFGHTLLLLLLLIPISRNEYPQDKLVGILVNFGEDSNENVEKANKKNKKPENVKSQNKNSSEVNKKKNRAKEETPQTKSRIEKTALQHKTESKILLSNTIKNKKIPQKNLPKGKNVPSLKTLEKSNTREELIKKNQDVEYKKAQSKFNNIFLNSQKMVKRTVLREVIQGLLIKKIYQRKV